MQANPWEDRTVIGNASIVLVRSSTVFLSIWIFFAFCCPPQDEKLRLQSENDRLEVQKLEAEQANDRQVPDDKMTLECQME